MNCDIDVPHHDNLHHVDEAKEILARTLKLIRSWGWQYDFRYVNYYRYLDPHYDNFDRNRREHDIDVHYQHNEYSDSYYRVTSEINKSHNQVADYIWGINDEKQAKQNDPTIKSWELVESGRNHDWKIISQVNNVVPYVFTAFVWPRQIVFKQIRIVEKNTIWIIGFSVQHPKCPWNDKKYVRGNLEFSAYSFTNIGPNATSVMGFEHIDPCGWVSESIVNTPVSRIVNMFKKWEQN